jgi:hypothetical protein
VPTSSSALRGLEGRIRKALDIVGEFGLGVERSIIPVMNLFDADQVGFHTYTGKAFAGSSTVVAAAGGQSKVIPRAHVEMVIDQHTIVNLGAAAGTVSLRYLAPGLADAFAFTELFTFWIEQTTGPVAEFMGLLNAVSNDATALGSIIWRSVIPPLSGVTFRMPVHLMPGARLSYHQDTVNQGTAASWSGYVV